MQNVGQVDVLQKYAGFWRRFAAIIIDFIVVSIIVFPFVVLIGLVKPDIIVVSTPFNLFTEERIIDTEKTEKENADGSTTAIETKLIEVTCLERWKYLYRETIEHNAGETETNKQLLDLQTKEDINRTTSEEIVFLVMFIYWILLESSKMQASFGKRALGIRVVDKQGRKLTLLRSLGRNVSKFFSMITLMIGFMMAGWTEKKQALHDIMSGCYVIVD